MALDAATDPGWLDNRIPVPISSILTVWLGHGVTAALPIWTTAQQLAAVRHPPRIDAQGFWLWLPQTSERVFVPWERVIAVATRSNGIRSGLFGYVHDVDEFARGDATALEKIRAAVPGTAVPRSSPLSPPRHAGSTSSTPPSVTSAVAGTRSSAVDPPLTRPSGEATGDQARMRSPFGS